MRKLQNDHLEILGIIVFAELIPHFLLNKLPLLVQNFSPYGLGHYKAWRREVDWGAQKILSSKSYFLLLEMIDGNDIIFPSLFPRTPQQKVLFDSYSEDFDVW